MTATIERADARIRARDRRKRWMPWVFPAIAVLLMGGVAWGAYAVMTSDLVAPDRPPTPDEVSADNTSQFTEAGISYIAMRQVATFNLASRPLSASDLGMADDDTQSATSSVGLVGTTFFTGTGGTDGEGYFATDMQLITVTTEGGVATEIQAELARTGWADFPYQMRFANAGVELFGWQFDQSVQDSFSDEVAANVRAGETSHLDIPAGSSFGVPVSGAIDCEGDGHCVMTYFFDIDA